MAITEDPRNVVSDVHAPYFGAELGTDTLMPGASAWHGELSFERWVVDQPRYVPTEAPRAQAS